MTALLYSWSATTTVLTKSWPGHSCSVPAQLTQLGLLPGYSGFAGVSKAIDSKTFSPQAPADVLNNMQYFLAGFADKFA